MQFYTVLFGVSRAFGVAAQLIWDRALGARMSLFLMNLATVLTEDFQLSSVPSHIRRKPSKKYLLERLNLYYYAQWIFVLSLNIIYPMFAYGALTLLFDVNPVCAPKPGVNICEIDETAGI